MPSLDNCMKDFQKHCKSQTNKIAHYVGIPALLFAVFILLGWIQITIPSIMTLSFAWMLVIGLIAYYAFICPLHAAITGVVLVLLKFIAGFFGSAEPNFFGFISFIVFLAIGAGALGYCCYSGAKKASIQDLLSQLLIAPLCVVTDVMQTLGFKTGSDKNSSSSKSD